MMPVTVIGAPVGAGAGRGGAEAGPLALRAAGLVQAIAARGRGVRDAGDLRPAGTGPDVGPAGRLKALPEIAAWTATIHAAVRAVPAGEIPLILGGDHSLSLGTLPALAERAARLGRPFFVLWIDAHPDCHTPATTRSGHLHGTPLAYALGADGFAPHFPPVAAPLAPENLLLLGIRDIDEAEAGFIAARGLSALTVEDLRGGGAGATLTAWLAHIRRAGGLLHVSLDADALDPAAAPGVGTPVAGGFAVGEVRAVLEEVAASGLLGSLELVEVNPFLDRGQATARTMVELAAAALAPRAATARRRRARA